MKALDKLNRFLKKAKIIHKESYDYRLINYVNSKTKVEIICKKHGNFMQLPQSHLQGHGCPLCGEYIVAKKRTKDTAYFIEKSNEVHNFKFNYSKAVYTKSRNKVIIICPIHGEFEQSAGTHMAGKDCWECGVEIRATTRRTLLDDFIQKSNKVHNYNFNYLKAIYVNNKTPLIITCPSHGDFKQCPANHLNGEGCKKCVNNTGWSRTKFINKYNEAILYIIQLNDDLETFIKVGITSNNIKSRYKGKNYYLIKSLFEIKNNSEQIWDLEKKVKRKFIKHQYFPQVQFGGYTECFDIDSFSQIKDFIINENI